ncbi:MAG TPA: spore germination protein GerW family protein [Fibrobacteraceae bacterium]|nr:spore germination protein GerW family protein [Fibrobacteraceae bacterium]
MSIENLAETLLEKLRWISQAETVVGKPFQSGETTIIPVSKVSLGFAIGGHAGKGDSSGSGGGVQVDPVAFLVIQGDNVRVLPVTKDNNLAQKVYDLIPDVIARFTSSQKE